MKRLEEQLTSEKKRDILLLIEHLLSSQETTARLVLGSLYDIGYVNIINTKVPGKPLKYTLKSVAKLSKGAFLVIALIWFKRNCPRLIANYLYSLVDFDEPETVPAQLTEVEVSALPIAESTGAEIQSLRRQVRLLTTMLIGAIALLGGGVVWLNYAFKLSPWELLQPRQSDVVNQPSSRILEPQPIVTSKEHNDG